MDALGALRLDFECPFFSCVSTRRASVIGFEAYRSLLATRWQLVVEQISSVIYD